jgi:PAS domain S-box-containing protein
MATGNKILIVEDEPLIAMEIEDRLISMGYAVSGVVSSGEKAIKKIAQTSPDLVLMDIMLEGDMDGVEAASQIRALFDIPVIYLTAYADSKTLERARISEPFGYLIKPFQERELHAAIEMALYKHSMEKKLRESENRYRTLAESAQDAIYILDSEGRHQYINSFGAKVIGSSPEEIIGKTMDDIFPPEISRKKNGEVKKVFKSRKPVSFEINIPLSGHNTWWDTKMVPLMVQNDEVQLVMCISRDITEHKLAEAALRRSKEFNETVLNTMTDAISIIDVNDFRIIDTNQAFSELYGLKKDDILGKHCYEITHKRTEPCAPPHDICPLHDVLGTGRNSIVEHKHFLKNKEIQYIEVSMSPIKDEKGSIISMVHVARDITERKRSVERLAKLNNCMLGFGPDYIDNINRITALCGELMGAACALYNRLDQGMLCSWGQWNTPPGYNPVDKPEGHICYDTINQGTDEILVVQNLPETRYARTDPNVMAYDLKTYVGRSVRLGQDYVGSLCVVYQKDYLPQEDDKRLMGIIASAIAVEERRRHAELALMEREAKLSAMIEGFDGLIYICSKDYRIEFMNSQLIKRTGYNGVGDYCYKVLHDRDSICPWCVNDRIFIGETVRWEVQSPRDNRWYYITNTPIYHQDGSISKQAMIIDINERKVVEKAHRESEEKYHALMNDAGDAIILADLNGNVMEVNKKTEELLGYTKEELSNMNIAQIHPEEMLERTIASFKVCANLNDGQVLRKDGKIVPVDITGSAIEYAGRKAILGIFRDITERKQAEEELRAKQFQLSEAQRIAHIGSWDVNFKTGETTWSDEMYHIYGVSPDTFKFTVEAFIKLIHPDDKKAMLRWIKASSTGKKEPDLEVRIVLPDGTVRFILGSGEVFFDEKGNPIRAIGTAQDITERKQSEELIKTSLKEKEVLLREIHHRVKNNMQIISSLLNLQAGYIEDKKYLDMLKDSQNRIMTMSLVHEKLYMSKNFTKINFKDYIHNLANSVFQSYTSRSGNILLNLNIEDIELGIDSAIPCGLIVNELVTNSIKYAFPGEKKGEIKIVLSKKDGNDYELTVSDNGIGFPEDIDFRKTETLGLHLVSLLAEEQLSGKINLNRSKGTEFSIRFGDGK